MSVIVQCMDKMGYVECRSIMPKHRKMCIIVVVCWEVEEVILVYCCHAATTPASVVATRESFSRHTGRSFLHDTKSAQSRLKRKLNMSN